jgi:high affinity Mn2+ porin
VSDSRIASKARAHGVRPVLSSFLALAVALAAKEAHAQASHPSGHDEEAFDVMNLLTHHGLHDIKDESWNAYGQFTYISSWKLPFPAAYTNANGANHSLVTGAERSFTATVTLYLGARLWPGAEVYFAPEAISLRPLSGLNGLGGAVQNFELQKTGTEEWEVYRSRAYLQQTIGFGGKRIVKTSDPLQLGTVVDSRRLVLRVGNFSILDFLDRNAFASDPRQQFFNLAFLTHSSYDFASDARGFSWGGVAELYFDDWALRYGRITPPKSANALPNELRFWQYYGDQVELEHKHEIFGRAGAIRLLAYWDRGLVGRFENAIAAYQADPSKNAANCGDRYNYGSQNATAPDLCWVRKTNWKYGVGLNLEQALTSDLGVFLRAMVSDGNVEVYAYMPPDRSVSFGALAKGTAWGRPRDLTGVAAGLAWISSPHADYFRMGGVDGFAGDGTLNRAMESVLEAFYSVHFLNAFWLSADYQHITHPAFNADRGPVNIIGARLHVEF